LGLEPPNIFLIYAPEEAPGINITDLLMMNRITFAVLGHRNDGKYRLFVYIQTKDKQTLKADIMALKRY